MFAKGASVGLLSATLLSGCAPSSAETDAITVSHCNYVQFIVASQNYWYEKRLSIREQKYGEVDAGILSQEEADRQFMEIAQTYVDLSKSIDTFGVPEEKPTVEFDEAARKYQDAVVDEESIKNPYLDEVFSACEAVGVAINPTTSDVDTYRGQY